MGLPTHDSLRNRLQTKRIISIQILRAVAAVFVVLSHFMRVTHEDWVGEKLLYEPAINLGNIGVYIFFIISGFIITNSSFDSFGSAERSLKFFAGRFSRIIPLYWSVCIVVLITGETATFSYAPTFLQAIDSFLLLPNTTNFVPFLIVGWTLTYEVLFYTVFGACLIVDRTKGLFIATTLLPTLFMLRQAFEVESAKPDYPEFLFSWYTQPLVMLFSIGILIALVLKTSPSIRFSGSVAISGIVVFVIASVFLSWPEWIFLKQRLSYLLPMITMMVVCLSKDISSSWSRSLATVGDWSYSLYLSHLIVLGVFNRIWLKILGAVYPQLFTMAGTVVCVAASGLVFWWAERPLHKWTNAALNGH